MAVTTPGAHEMYCSSCGVIIKRRAEICVHCGVRVAAPLSSARPAAPMHCSSCGEIINRNAEICVHCGVRVAAPPSSPARTAFSAAPTAFSDKSRVAAGVLGILLGGFGVHSFYLGNIGKGVIQIIVTLITLGIGSLWGLIEGIIIIADGGWRDGQGRPLRKYNE